MFRTLHLGCDLGYNYVKGLVGLEYRSTAESLQTFGGIYSKITQINRITDPSDQLYNECKQVNATETKSRLMKYITQCQIPCSEPTFLASGSIGAVYRIPTTNQHGQTDATLLFKVLYVGIEDLWQQDIQMIRTLIGTKDLVYAQDSSTLIEQLESIMKSELDYQQEMRNHLWFYTTFQSHPDIVIPKPEPSMSNQYILATRFVESVSMLEFLATADYSSRQRMADTIYHFHLYSLQHGKIYADYHWGNLRVNSDNQLVILDFGMVDTLTPYQIYLCMQMTVATMDDDEVLFTSILQEYDPVACGNSQDHWRLSKLLTMFTEPTFKVTATYITDMEHLMKQGTTSVPGGAAHVRASLLMSGLILFMDVALSAQCVTKIRNMYTTYIREYQPEGSP